MGNTNAEIEALNFWDLAAADEQAERLNLGAWASPQPTPILDPLDAREAKSAPALPTSPTSFVDPFINYLNLKYKGTQLDEPTHGLLNDLKLHSVYANKHARPYQEVGVKFGLGYDNDQLSSSINDSVRCCIADQMRLGKTPQGLLILKNLIATKRVKKTLIVLKSANIYQWVNEILDWINPIPSTVWTIGGGKSFIPNGFSIYTISMDTLRTCETKLIQMGFDCILIDEAHSFKNVESSRTTSLNNIINISKIKNIIFLTGTPILNRADEYYTILHHCSPAKFPTPENYKHKWLEQDDKGRYSRIKSWKVEQFRKEIESFVIRREKEDVYQDSPALDINYSVIKIEEKNLQDLYNKELDKMNDKIAQAGGKVSMLTMQDSLITLRRICGMAKVKPTIDIVNEFLEESERGKIAIGIHHKDVRETLRLGINRRHGVLTFSGEDSSAKKFDIMDNLMKLPQNRVLIINMQAGGEGADFNYINDFVVTERMWNPPKEEQFNFRFYNPDRSIKNVSTTGEVLIAKGTIDEYWHNMIVGKKVIVNEVYENGELNLPEVNFKDLIQETLDNRL
jgi:SNF2 family DNA or RNA helicase